jgi:hypothetical protein
LRRVARIASERLAAEHRQMLDDRAERQSGKITQQANDDDNADQQTDEWGPGGGNVPAEGAAQVLAASPPAGAMIGTQSATKTSATTMESGK